MVRVFNITHIPTYSGHCHRDIPSGGGFSVPYGTFVSDRRAREWIGVRFMAFGDDGEESPYLYPREMVEAALDRVRPKPVAASVVQSGQGMADPDEAARLFACRAETVAPRPVKVRSDALPTEVPVTPEDIIPDSGSAPASIADAVRHNKAIRRFR